MMFTYFSKWQDLPLHEHRRIFAIPSLPEYFREQPQQDPETIAYFEKIGRQKGVPELLNAFAPMEKNAITRDALEKFLQEQNEAPDDPEHLCTALQTLFEESRLSPNDIPESDPADPRPLEQRINDMRLRQLNANTRLDALIRYLRARVDILKKTKQKLATVREKSEPPSPIEYAKEKIVTIWQAFGDAYRDSGTGGKLTMVAGVISAFLLWRALEKNADSGKEGFWKTLGLTLRSTKKAAGIALGVGLGAAALGAVNRTVEKTRGRPLFNWSVDGGGLFPGLRWSKKAQGEWDAAKHKQELRDEWERLRTMNIPVEEFTDFLDPSDFAEARHDDRMSARQTTVGELLGANPHSEEDSARQEKGLSYSFAITNVCALSMKELGSLYSTHKEKREIHDSAAPRRPFRKDFLPPSERFALVEDIANDLGFISVGKNELEWNDENREEDMKQSVLYMAMSFQQFAHKEAPQSATGLGREESIRVSLW